MRLFKKPLHMEWDRSQPYRICPRRRNELSSNINLVCVHGHESIFVQVWVDIFEWCYETEMYFHFHTKYKSVWILFNVSAACVYILVRIIYISPSNYDFSTYNLSYRVKLGSRGSTKNLLGIQLNDFFFFNSSSAFFVFRKLLQQL